MSSIVEDVYSFLSSSVEVKEEAVSELASSLATTIANRLKDRRKPSLSMSQVGKAHRRLWMDLKYPVEPSPSLRLKFLYGDIIETIVLWLVRQSGHTVERQQESVCVDGVRGSIDAIIDNKYLTDVKSCSARAYQKFSKGYLPQEDPFGYISQISGYNEALPDYLPMFLAMNKETGELCTYEPDKDFDLVDIHKVIKEAKEAVASEEMPKEPCYQTVPIGKSGNIGLASGCKLCPHKTRCWKDVRVFQYAKGYEYLTVVNKEPQVEEVTKQEEA